VSKSEGGFCYAA